MTHNRLVAENFLKIGIKPNNLRVTVEETIEVGKRFTSSVKTINLKNYLLTMKDNLAICFQRIIKKSSLENVRKQLCKTCHIPSTIDSFKEVYSFYSDQRKSTGYP